MEINVTVIEISNPTPIESKFIPQNGIVSLPLILNIDKINCKQGPILIMINGIN